MISLTELIVVSVFQIILDVIISEFIREWRSK